MSTPVIVWIAIIGLFIAVVIVRLTVSVIRSSGHLPSIFSIGTEREEFYVPGDSFYNEEEEYMYDEA